MTIEPGSHRNHAGASFYTLSGEWVDAGDLEPGDWIQSYSGDFGTIEAVVFVAITQPMYNLTVDEAHTFFIGDGEWLVHNASCPRLLEIPEDELGKGRYRVATLNEIPKAPGIYEFIHRLRKNLPYVGSTHDLWDRIPKHVYGGRAENYISVVFTPLDGAIKLKHLQLAETIRILQVRSEFGDDIYNMANGWNENLEKITTRPYPSNPNSVPKYWSNADELKIIQRLMNNSKYPWPSWLRP